MLNYVFKSLLPTFAAVGSFSIAIQTGDSTVPFARHSNKEISLKISNTSLKMQDEEIFHVPLTFAAQLPRKC